MFFSDEQLYWHPILLDLTSLWYVQVSGSTGYAIPAIDASADEAMPDLSSLVEITTKVRDWSGKCGFA